jgi:predicted MFS family arabinose efflux permease
MLRFRHASPNPNGHPSFGGRSVDNSLAKKPCKDWEFIFGHKADEEQIQTGNLMISQWLSAALARRNIHYGWVMVGVTFLTAVITAGTVGAPGVFIVPLQKEFGWSTAEISSALSIRFILFGLMAPFAAALHNRFGLRNVTLSALVIVASALVISLKMTELWQLMLLWGVAIGLGTGMTALVLGATVASRWFAARRGLAVGILTAAVATGQLVFLPLLASLTEWMGWRVALGLMCGLLGLAAFAVSMMMRDRPSDVGLRPFGDEGTQPLPAPPPSTAPIMAAALGALRDGAKSRVFWILFATFFICGASTTGLVQVHLIPMCLDFGIPQVQAAGLLAAMGMFDLVGTIGSGWLSDRYDNRYLLFWYYGLRGFSLLFLPFTNFSFYGLSLFAMIYGLDWIATVPPTVRLTAQRFGPERANLVFGWIYAGHQLGAATAAFGAGLSRTVLATYLPAFFAAGALCIVAALITLAIARQPKQVLA